MMRNAKRFSVLYNLLLMWDRDTAHYYGQCVDGSPELATESILLEMETSLLDCTQEITKCELG